MKTENLSTLKINKLSDAQFQKVKDDGKIDQTAMYLTPDTSVSYMPQSLTLGDQAQARENIGVAQAFESDDHPGCYYRWVDSEQEWINPPMILGEEYRTTERHDGKPVLVTLTENGVYKRTEDKVINTKPSGTYTGTGDVEGSDEDNSVAIGVGGTALIIVCEDGFAIIKNNEAGTYVSREGTITKLTGANCWWQPAVNNYRFGMVGDSVINRKGVTYLWSVI